MSKISVRNIKKYFGKVKALDGISLEVKDGSVLGLLGPNGAGKTTLVNILTTLIKPDSGSAKVAGIDAAKDARALRTKIGLAGQSAAVDEYLTGRENLEMVARLYHLPKKEARKRTDDVLAKIGLSDSADRQAKTYSGGMRKRLDLGASLLYRPEVLFLDEPTTGLDPKTRLDLWELIREMVADGTTLLLTTQYLEEADELADQIVVINHGRVVAKGTSNELKKKLGSDYLELELAEDDDTKKLAKILKKTLAKDGLVKTDEKAKTVGLTVANGVKDLEKALGLARKSNIEISHVNLSQPSLDDVFLHITKGDSDA